MAQGVDYNVNAVLRTEGSFGREISSAARSADRLGMSWSRMGDRLVTAGDRVRGTYGMVARDMAKGAVIAGAAGLAGSVAFAARKGIEFNNSMEQGALSLATMYTTFGLASKSGDVLSGTMTEFAKSLELAEAMQQELFDVAKKSPATFEEVKTAYDAMAPSISGITGDLIRQRDLMKQVSVLSFATAGDYKQLGADVGRIVKGLAGADVQTFSKLQPAIESAFEEATGKTAAADFAQQWNKLARVDPEQALSIFEKAIEPIGGEINDAFGASFSGVAATVGSELQSLAGEFGAPLQDSIKRAMIRATSEGGILSTETLTGLRGAAQFAGQQLGKAADKLFSKLEAGVRFVAENWAMIATKIQQAGVLAGAALKAAAAVATSRMVAGAAMVAAGRAAQAGGAVARGAKAAGTAWRAKAKAEHVRRARAMHEGGGGRVRQAIGKLGGRKGPLGGLMRGLDKGMLKIATLGPMLLAAGAAAGMLALAFGGVIAIAGGLAAYVVSNWEKIKTSIVQGLKDGTITLVPLITALYTFWERLKLMGEALFGGSSAATMMQGGIDFMTMAVDAASVGISYMVKGLALMVGVIGALKLGIAKFFQLVAWGLEKMSKIPKMGGLADTAAEMRKSQGKWMDSAQDTFTRAEKLGRAADAIAEAKLDPLKYKAAQKKAKDLEKSLMDMLSGKGEKGRGKKAGVKIGKVEVVVNTTDPDPDRLFASFIPKLERMADKRIQPWDALEQGT